MMSFFRLVRSVLFVRTTWILGFFLSISSLIFHAGRNDPCESVFTAPNLPHEIIVEIISRLPVKSLCRFRCVSKLWLSTISSPQFAKTHLDLAFQNNTQKQVLIIWANWKVCSIDWASVNADDVINKGVVAVELDNSLKNYPSSLNFINILSSSNGLVCIADTQEESLLVINPCTGESRKIPVASQKYHNCWNSLVHGFGYSSKSDDYKLVRIDAGNIGMYSLRSGTWSKCTTTPRMPYHISRSAYGVPLNGALHWLGSLTPDEEGNCVVVCFDLTENTIREMPMPAPLLDYDVFYDLSLGVINGCLCAHYRDKHAEGFWVMREYNNGESWTKISTSSVALDTLGLGANKRVNRQKVRRKIVLCNFENGTHGIPTEGGFKVGTYVESLISPNHYAGE